MSYIVSHLRRRSNCSRLMPSLPFLISRQLLTQGLLVMLLGTIGAVSITKEAIAQTATSAQNTSPSNAIEQKLLGQWQAKDPTSNTQFTFIFAPENKLFVVLPGADNSLVALEVAYQINSTTQPMQLDIQLSPEQKAFTIFEFTPEGKLRLPLEGLTPGLPRPTQFNSNSTLFAKTSDATTVPENIEIIKPEIAKSKTPQDEVKTYMLALTQVQQARYREQGKFAETIEEVSVGLKTETESYRYKFVPQGNNTKSVMIIAQAKTEQLPSYTGAVFATQVNGETTTIAQICETEKPSTTVPEMPSMPMNNSSEIKCPMGSRSLIQK